jgi:hypothetical protein
MTIGLLDVARAPYRPNAAPAATDRLDHHARAVLSGEEDPGLLKAHRMGAAGRERHSAARGERRRLGLVAEKGELLGRRANPSQTRRLASFGEFRVFAQKTLAGVDGVASGLPGDGVERRPVEIGRRSERLQRCALPPEYAAP